MKMHADEVATDEALVRRLLAEQFPHLANLDVTKFESYGTDHDIYRLGEQLVARLPRIGWATTQAAKEREWLPKIAPQVPLALPVQRAMGHATPDYPFDWSVYEWLPGQSLATATIDLQQAAVDLAAFIVALRKVATTGAHRRPPARRGAPLSECDEQVRRSISALGTRIDATAATRLWDESLAAGPWTDDEFACLRWDHAWLDLSDVRSTL